MEAVKGSFAYEYRKEGMQQGIQQGMHEKEIQIAKNMLALGLEKDTIQKATGLSQEEIEKIQQKK